jgi:hypothetical protein
VELYERRTRDGRELGDGGIAPLREGDRVVKPPPGKIVLAATDAVTALQPYVDRVLRAIAIVCDEPSFTDALVTDESWLSDFSLTADDYPRLSNILGVQLDPTIPDDRVIYRIAAKLKGHNRRGTA